MSVVYSWNDLVAAVGKHFPHCDPGTLHRQEGDVGALVMHLSAAHELTLAEAAEMVAFRLPVFVHQAPRLSA